MANTIRLEVSRLQGDVSIDINQYHKAISGYYAATISTVFGQSDGPEVIEVPVTIDGKSEYRWFLEFSTLAGVETTGLLVRVLPTPGDALDHEAIAIRSNFPRSNDHWIELHKVTIRGVYEDEQSSRLHGAALNAILQKRSEQIVSVSTNPHLE